MKSNEQQIAEEATGMMEHPDGCCDFYTGPLFRDGCVTPGGDKLETTTDIINYLRKGGLITSHGAGAGSYRKVFSAMGFKVCDVWDHSSSAGDWTFVVSDGASWYPAFQTNRYPLHGFDYCVDFTHEFDTKEDIVNYLSR